MSNKDQFNQLRKEIALPLKELAAVLGLGYGTVKAYASDGNPRVPPYDVLARMQNFIIERSVARLERLGFEVTEKE